MATLEPLKKTLDQMAALISAGVAGLSSVTVGWPGSQLAPPMCAIHVAGSPVYEPYSPYSRSKYLAKVSKGTGTYNLYFSRGDKMADVLVDFWGRNGNDLSDFVPKIKDCLSQVSGFSNFDLPYREINCDPGVSGIKTCVSIRDEDFFGATGETENIGQWRRAIKTEVLYPDVYIKAGVLHTETQIKFIDWVDGTTVERTIDIPI